MLGPHYVVFNLGKGGTNTKHHIEAILKYPYHPDILILSYVFNDIQGAVLEQQWLNRPKNPSAPRWLAPLIKNSYALNFLYWRAYRLLEANQPDTTWGWYLSVYNEPDSWWIHQQQLLSISEGAKSEKIPLFVVVFPSLNYPAATQVVTQRIVKLFQENNVSVLDVTNLIQGIPTKELIDSATDAHPSELVHELVAEALYKQLTAAGLVK
jgi:hypothetical protein